MAAAGRIAAVVYVSTASSALVGRLSKLCSMPGARLLNVFSDEPYARTSLLIAGDPGAVVDSASRVAAEAVEALDLRTHSATHPRIGTVDHISVASLDDGPGDVAGASARQVMDRTPVGTEPKPVGTLSCSGRSAI